MNRRGGVIMQKPVPVVNSWSAYFWQAAREGKLALQQCQECHKVIFYPRVCCPQCFSENLQWIETSGKGTVYSYTIVKNNAPSAFIEEMPFVIAIVQLEEGVRMLSNIVKCDPEEVYCEMPIQVVFERLNDEFTLPKFKQRG